MSDVLKELQVALSLDTSGFSNDAKKMNSHINDMQSKFKLASKTVDGFENSFDGLSSKIQILETKISSSNTTLNKMSQELQNAKDKTQSLKDKMDTAKTTYENNARALEKLAQEGKEGTEEFNQLKETVSKNEQEFRKAESAYNRNQSTIDRLTNSINKTKLRMADMNNELNTTRSRLASLKFDNLSKQLDAVSKKFTSVGKSLTTMGSTLTRSITLPVVALGTAAVKASVDFEASMSNVQAISGASAEDLQRLSEKAREMGKLTSKSAKEASDALSYMALAGWDTEQMLVGLEPILRLSEAGNLDLAKASDLATDSLSAMGLTAQDLEGYLDVVTKTSTTANTSIEQLLDAFIVAGPVAKQLSIPTESLSSALAMLANNGIKSSEAGKAMSSILSRLSKPTKDVQKSLDALNIDLFDSKGNFKGLEVVLGDLNKAFAGLTEEQKLQHATSLAGKNYLSQFLMLVDSGDGTMQKYTESLKDANGTLNNVAETMKANAQGNIERLKSAFGELMIVIGDKLVPHLSKFVVKLTDMINKFAEMDPELQNNILKWVGIAAAIGPVLSIVGKMSTGIGALTKAGSLLSSGLGKIAGKMATTTAATTATTTAMAGASAGASATGGVFATLGPILCNPWVLAGAAVVGTTAVIVSETKKQKENIEQMAADAKEAVHGLEQRYETLSTNIESSIQSIRESNEEWMTPEAKAKLTQDMKDIQKILNGGGGNATKEIKEMANNIKEIWGNLTPELQEKTSTAIANMIETFIRDGSILPKEANKLIDEVQEILGVELHINTEGIANDLQLEGIFSRMGENLQKSIGWFGINRIGGDIEDAARSIVDTVTTEFKGMENIDTSKFFAQVKSQLIQLGASSTEQADIIKDTLKPALVETFGGEGTAQYIMDYVNSFYSASEAPKALTEALQEVNKTYPSLTLDQQVALDDMNAQLIEKLGVQEEIMSGSVQNMLSQSSECWAGMVGNQLIASENMEADLNTFTLGAVEQIKNMSDDLDGQMKAAEWFNTFITRLVETGAISSEQAQNMANQINGALNKEVVTTSKIDASQFDNGVKTSLNKINELTGKIANPSSLLDDKKFNETETALKKKIDELNKSKAEPKVIAEATQALSDLRLLKERIDALYDKTVTIKEKRITEYQTLYTHGGYAGAGAGPVKPKTVVYTDEATTMMARATALTDDISTDYQVSGGYYSRTSSPKVLSPVEEAIMRALEKMTGDKNDNGKSLTQNITINSPTNLSPRQIARETKLAGQQLLRLY